jgi:hypothetical protein
MATVELAAVARSVSRPGCGPTVAAVPWGPPSQQLQPGLRGLGRARRHRGDTRRSQQIATGSRGGRWTTLVPGQPPRRRAGSNLLDGLVAPWPSTRSSTRRATST